VAPPGDYRELVGTGAYTIPAGGSVRVMFALVAGSNFIELQATADAARAVQFRPNPTILSARDVPNDQGGHVTLRWNASSLDDQIHNLPSYSIWRSLPDGAQRLNAQTMGLDVIGEKVQPQIKQQGGDEKLLHKVYAEERRGIRTRITIANNIQYAWELIAEVPAHRFVTYSYTAPTLYDSMSTTDGRHYFLVSAQTSDPYVYYDSNIDSGYSVDNLSPAVPLHAEVISLDNALIRLRWDQNTHDPDVGGYIVYRSRVSGCPIADSTYLCTTRDTSVVDSSVLAGQAYYYRVVTVDIHGNSSIPTGVLTLSFTQVMSGGWNMIALPSSVTNGYYLSLYPSATPGTLYTFNGSYIGKDTLKMGTGYWLNFSSPSTAVTNGSTVSSAMLSLASGWNMIGGISCAVPISSVSDPGGIIIAGTLYGFNGSYVSSDTIQRGKGYWICTRAAGTIGLACGSGMAKVKAGQDIASFPTLTIRDATGIGRTLSWDVALEDTTAKLSFRLPPLPPVGSFDVRFTDDMSICENAQGTIAIQATAYPLTVTPTQLPSGGVAQYTLTEVMGNADGAAYVLTNNTVVTITKQEVTRLRLGKVEVEPLVFALHQNYPNPFNPSTTIRYSMPHTSFVTLTIYNTLGQQVAQLVNEQQQAGYHDVVFRGDGLASGVYYYRIQAGDFVASKKLLLLK
jgi:hypothetical protein